MKLAIILTAVSMFALSSCYHYNTCATYVQATDLEVEATSSN